MEKKFNIFMSNKVNAHIRLRSDQKGIWMYNNKSLTYQNNDKTVSYNCFDSVFYKQTNKEFYDLTIKNLVECFNSGENVTIFAYGQTGSGKTHTIFGSNEEDGIVQLSISDIFKDSREKITLSFIELFNEKIFDLYNKNELKMFSSNGKNVINNLDVFKASTFDEAMLFLRTCERNRRSGVTEYNEKSSRSHAILRIMRNEAEILFIDLAGSERATSNKDRKLEGAYINKSLLALGKLVNNLLENNALGFRESKLTRILQSSLNEKTNIAAICAISSLKECLSESLSTLGFAARISNLKLKNQTREAKKKHPSDEIVNDTINRLNQIIEIMKNRIDGLEKTVVDLLHRSSNRSIKDIFVLEKQMFNMILSKCDPDLKIEEASKPL